jgi:hypothetical protein
MKILLLLAGVFSALAFGGCVAVVDDGHPAYGSVSVSYYHGRPYYYRSGVRYWGYPAGYRGPYRDGYYRGGYYRGGHYNGGYHRTVIRAY